MTSLFLTEGCIAPVAMPNGETRCGELEEAPVHYLQASGKYGSKHHEWTPAIRLAHNRSRPDRCRCGADLHPSWKGYALHLEEAILSSDEYPVARLRETVTS